MEPSERTVACRYELKTALDGHSYVSMGSFHAYQPSLPAADADVLYAILSASMRLHGLDEAFALSWIDELSADRVGRVVQRLRIRGCLPWSPRTAAVWRFDRSELRDVVQLVWSSPCMLIASEASFITRDRLKGDSHELPGLPDGELLLYGFYEHEWIDIHSGTLEARDVVARLAADADFSAVALKQVFDEM